MTTFKDDTPESLPSEKLYNITTGVTLHLNIITFSTYKLFFRKLKLDNPF